MKKTLYIITIAILALVGLSSCDKYFDVDLKDQPTLEEQFSKYLTAKQFSANCYAYLPYEEKQDAREGGVIRRSDESLFGFTSSASNSVFWQARIGDASPATYTPYGDMTNPERGNFWDRYYQGIRQCTLVMQYAHLVADVDQKVRDYMVAEARFLRAYYYFLLFRYYGPVIIWGDEIAPENVLGSDLDRNTVERNIEFIVDQLDLAAEVLPLNVGDIGGVISTNTDTGRPTKGAALALKARVLLYAASPLYNGNSLYAGMTNYYGENIFPQEYDGSKWEKAAQAALDVINMRKYSLLQASSKDFKGYAEAYRGVYSKNWQGNTEVIWGWWHKSWEPGNTWLGTVGGQFPYLLPGKFAGIMYSYGGWMQPSLKLVDAYPMYESGRYPVTGYEHDGNGLNLSRPYVDPDSGYETEGFVENWDAPHLDWDMADGKKGVKAHKSTIGRDPRYYVSLIPNGHYWPNKNMNTVLTMYQNKSCAAPWTAGTSCNYVGYVFARLLPTDNNFADQAAYTSAKAIFPTFRMAEIYLNYAEALNEQPNRDGAGACAALNQVRNRVGLKNIEEAYPGIAGNKTLLRWCIQQERMVEFAWEAHRHYDACRWMIAKEEYPSANWTLHLSADNYEDSYERVDTDHPYANRPAVFSDKDYLFPMSSDELKEMVNYTQNYGY